jgi:hypothetical protein
MGLVSTGMTMHTGMGAEVKKEGEDMTTRHGFGLLIAKVILGALAAGVAMVLMRVFGTGEILVAFFIGAIPGIAEKSPKKLAAGALLGIIGYVAGAHVGKVIAKTASGVPLGHWAIVGGFIGITAGIARYPGQSTSSRVVGTLSGIILGLVFGILGDIGGFLTVPVSSKLGLGLFYYLREVSLVCAGVFINLAAALASMLALAADRRTQRNTAAVESPAA